VKTTTEKLSDVFPRQPRFAGFTLIELLVVIAIILKVNIHP